MCVLDIFIALKIFIHLKVVMFSFGDKVKRSYIYIYTTIQYTTIYM